MIINEENFENLTYVNVGGRGSILKEFTLESLENLKLINVETLSKLIKDCCEIISTIEDETIKRVIISRLRAVIDAHKACYNFNPSDYFNGNKSPSCFYSKSCGMHKFGGIIEFLTETFKLIMYNNSHNCRDEDKLYNILNLTKTACKKLGIYSLDPTTIYEMLQNPGSEDYFTYSCQLSIDDTNTLDSPTGIAINNLPYHFSWPLFRNDGTFIGVEIIPVKEGDFWFTQKKYDELINKKNNYKLG